MSYPTVRRRDRGADVERLQNALLSAAGSHTHDSIGMPYPVGKILEADGIYGDVTYQALTAFQTQQQLNDPNFDVDGVCGTDTWAALGIHVQPGPTRPTPTAANPQAAPVDNLIYGPTPPQQDASNFDLPAPPDAGDFGARVYPPVGSDMPVWMDTAWREHASGIQELYGGNRNNQRILEYLEQSHTLRQNMVYDGRRNATRIRKAAARADDRREARGRERTIEDSFIGKRAAEVDETPWCGCFVQFCMTAAHFPRRPNFTGAAFWKPRDGEESRRIYGAVCVVQHDSGGHHVGFYLGDVAGGVKMLGGNQSNKVAVQDYINKRNYYFLWPQNRPTL